MTAQPPSQTTIIAMQLRAGSCPFYPIGKASDAQAIIAGMEYRGRTGNDPVYKKAEFTHTRPPEPA